MNYDRKRALWLIMRGVQRLACDTTDQEQQARIAIAAAGLQRAYHAEFGSSMPVDVHITEDAIDRIEELEERCRS